MMRNIRLQQRHFHATPQPNSFVLQHRQRLHIVVPRSSKKHKQLLETLQDMEDTELQSWWDSNRDELTLSFLGWIADQEQSTSDSTQKHKLWQLGSKLMALREGFAPLTSSQLNEQLQNTQSDNSDNTTNNTPSSIQQSPPGSFAAVVKQSSLLGLSPEGMALLEQQAAALEAAMGTTRAQALTEIIGRAKITTPQQRRAMSTAQNDGTMRILEVLVQVEDRESRAAMLPDAFTPPSLSDREEEEEDDDGIDDDEDDQVYIDDDDDDDDSEDEEMVYTTPWQLLQCVDLWLQRIEKSSLSSTVAMIDVMTSDSDNNTTDDDNTINSNRSNTNAAVVMFGDGAYQSDQLQQILYELREDILNVWDVYSTDEDF